jgi:cell division septum initiation protein DivIVA
LDTYSHKDDIRKRIENLEKEIEDAQDTRFELKKQLQKIRAKEIEESMHENNQQLLKG